MKKKLLIIIFLFTSTFGQSNNFNISILSTPETKSPMLNSKFKGINENNFLLVPYIELEKNSYKFISRSFLGAARSEIDLLLLQYSLNKINLKAGKFSRNITTENILKSSGSMIESNNSLKPWRIGGDFYYQLNTRLSFYGDIYHGIIDKNKSYLKDPFLHEKSFYLDYKSNNSKFTFGIVHNTIWGGKVNGFGDLGGSFQDWLDVIIGDPGNDNKPDGEQVNSLGDAFGIFDFSYSLTLKTFNFRAYHQHFFEDKSGMQFKNKFDGLYGLELSNKKYFLLLEHLNTKNQSGNIHPPGLDSYYWNMIYTEGWVYDNQVIGNPYINPNNNRIILDHILLEKKSDKFSILFSYLNHKIFKSFNGTNNDLEFDLTNDLVKSKSEFFVGFEKKFNNYDLSILSELNKKENIIELNYIF